MKNCYRNWLPALLSPSQCKHIPSLCLYMFACTTSPTLEKSNFNLFTYMVVIHIHHMPSLLDIWSIFMDSWKLFRYLTRETLPENVWLPCALGFAVCNISGTRQTQFLTLTVQKHTAQNWYTTNTTFAVCPWVCRVQHFRHTANTTFAFNCTKTHGTKLA